MAEYMYEVYKIIGSCVLIFVAWFVIELIKLKRFHGTLKRLGIPGPEPSILKAGNMKDIYANYPHKDMICEWAKQNNGLAGFYLDNQINIVTNDLDILKTVLIDKPQIFSDRQDLLMDHAFSESVSFLKRDRWKINRSIFAWTFTAYGSNSPDVLAQIKRSADELVSYLGKQAERVDGKLVAKNIDIIKLMKSYTMNTIAHVAAPELDCEVGGTNYFSTDLDNYYMGNSLYTLATTFPFLAPFFNRLQIIKDKFMSFGGIYKLLDERIKITTEYLIMRRKLGDAYKGGQTADEKMLDESYANHKNKVFLRSLFLTFIDQYVNGTITHAEMRGNLLVSTPSTVDTMGLYFNSLIWCLAKHQFAQEKAREEVKRHGFQAPYLRMFMLEAHRLYPVFANGTRRKSNQDCSIKGIKFPKGTVFVYNTQLMGRNTELFPDWERFDPERFAEEGKLHPCYPKPFGFGAKQCPALRYAMNEMRMTLAEVLLNYKLTLVAPFDLKLKLWQIEVYTPTEKIYVDFEKIDQCTVA